MHIDLVYADDLTTVITSPDLDVLRDYSVKNEENVKNVMNTKNLSIQRCGQEAIDELNNVLAGDSTS